MGNPLFLLSAEIDEVAASQCYPTAIWRSLLFWTFVMHSALHILPHVALMMPLEQTSTYHGTTVQPDTFTRFSKLVVLPQPYP